MSVLCAVFLCAVYKKKLNHRAEELCYNVLFVVFLRPTGNLQLSMSLRTRDVVGTAIGYFRRVEGTNLAYKEGYV